MTQYEALLKKLRYREQQARAMGDAMTEGSLTAKQLLLAADALELAIEQLEQKHTAMRSVATGVILPLLKREPECPVCGHIEEEK